MRERERESPKLQSFDVHLCVKAANLLYVLRMQGPGAKYLPLPSIIDEATSS